MAKMRNLNQRNRPMNIVRSAFFTAAVLGNTIMGCGTSAPAIPPHIIVHQGKVIGIEDMLRSGKGSKNDPYLISILENEKTTDIGSIAVMSPIDIKIENNHIYFNIELNISQLRTERIGHTEKLLEAALEAAIAGHYKNRELKLDGKVSIVVRKALEEIVAKAAAADVQIQKYLSCEELLEPTEPQDERITITYFVLMIDGKVTPCKNLMLSRQYELSELDIIEDIGRIAKIDQEGMTLKLDLSGHELMVEYGKTLRVHENGIDFKQLRPEKNEKEGAVTVYLEVSSTVCATPPSKEPEGKTFNNTEI